MKVSALYSRIIGLDLGTTMGYAYTETDRVVPAQTGTANFAPKRHEGGGMRYIRFKKMVMDLTASKQPIVYYEEVTYHRGADASHVYGGFIAVLHSWCYENGIPYRGVPIGTIKRRATRSGRANKSDMVRAAFNQWGVRMTHDQADAAWVLQCGLDELGGNDECETILNIEE